MFHSVITASRQRYLAAALLTIAAGLLVHGGVVPMGPRLRDVAGDVLWAMMMVWWMGVLAPAVSPATRGGVALAVCVGVELSQRHHAAWLDAIRATLPGQLVLGSGFDVRDLVAYAAGVLLATTLDRRRRPGRQAVPGV
jgi:hypothetical protein